jgi:MFS family permease
MLAQRMIGVSSVCGAFVGATMMSVVSYVPLFVQGVLGGSPTEAGATITPMVIAWPLASALGGRILPRLGFRPLIHSGMAMVAAASVALALLLQPEMNLNWSRACVGLMGLGLGFANTALLIAVQTSVEWQQRGVATASTMFFRTMGGMFAVGVMGGILASALARDPSIPVEAANELLGPEHGRTLSPEVLRRLAGALQGGLGTVFWIIAALGIASFLSSLALPKMDVRQSE